MQKSRIQIPNYEEMSDAQKAIYDGVIRFLGEPIGPRMALISVPDIAKKWGELLQAIQASDLPKRFWELSILVVARYWNSQFEFWAHEKKSLAEGISQDVIDSIKQGKKPSFIEQDEAIVYQYAYELMYNKMVEDKTYEDLRGLIGSQQIIEMTVLMGHYNSVAMTLVAHNVPLPKGTEPPLPKLP